MSGVNNVCVVLRQPPVGKRGGLEVLRLSLALLTGDLDYKLILKEDGVFHALRDLPEQTPGGRETARSLMGDTIDFDIPVYAVSEDLKERRLDEDDILPGIGLINEERIYALIAGADTTLYL